VEVCSQSSGKIWVHEILFRLPNESIDMTEKLNADLLLESDLMQLTHTDSLSGNSLNLFFSSAPPRGKNQSEEFRTLSFGTYELGSSFGVVNSSATLDADTFFTFVPESVYRGPLKTLEVYRTMFLS
jgi:hypothetical protein